jgi:hypothetical protein
MDITEIQDELLRLEYPNLLPDHDPDIERYYYLRTMGQAREAMNLYQNRLKIRYPDDEFRTWLLRSYRSHDPSFRGLLAKGYRLLGARSLERIKRIILQIAEQAESYNEKDVYSTIKTAEEVIRFLPRERFEAVAGIERYLRYAVVLKLKAESLAKAADLVRAYLTDTLSIVEEERRRRSTAEQKARDAELQRLVKADWESYLFQKKYGARSSLIDLSSVVFSPSDLARIEIPPYSRIEDQVLAYCIKYWNATNDPAFERILFLYSRKYGKKNYDVYMIIRRGKAAKQKDDEILASIMGALITGYYYSIQGDIYLQRSWNAIKFALQIQSKALPAKPPAKALPGGKPAVSSARARVKPDLKKPGAKVRSQAGKIAPKPKSKTAPKIAPKPVIPGRRPAVVIAKPAPRPVAARPAAPAPKPPVAARPAQPAPKPPIAAKPIPKPSQPAVFRSVQPAPRPAATRPPAPAPRPVPKPPVAAKPVPKPVQSVPRPVSVRPPVPAPKPPVVAKPPIAARPAQPAPKPTQPAVFRPVQPAPRSAAAKLPVPAPRPPAAAKPPVAARPVQQSAPKPVPPRMVFTPKTLEKAKGSVSDRLKQLSGRSYDVYQDRFLAKARSAIRKVLGAGKGLFFNLPEEAEDLVYNFLREHYSDPYMDWENSTDRKNLMALGFDLSSLNPVIDECYRTL